MYNASDLLGTSNQFIKILGDQELNTFHPQVQGVQRAVSQTCNNHGSSYPTGRCSFKITQGQGSYNGRTITFRSEVYPANVAASTGLNGLITKNNEPAEIDGDGRKKKESGVVSVANAMKWPFTNG